MPKTEIQAYSRLRDLDGSIQSFQLIGVRPPHSASVSASVDKEVILEMSFVLGLASLGMRRIAVRLRSQSQELKKDSSLLLLKVGPNTLHHSWRHQVFFEQHEVVQTLLKSSAKKQVEDSLLVAACDFETGKE